MKTGWGRAAIAFFFCSKTTRLSFRGVKLDLVRMSLKKMHFLRADILGIESICKPAA